MNSPLIDAAALNSLLGSERPPVVLDVRWVVGTGTDRAAFDAGHIPGAQFIDLDTQLAAPAGSGGRHPIPSAAAFEESMRAAGVNAASAVVVYDGGPATSAARAWWLLRYFGHRDVRVLDGGYSYWAASGFGIETLSATPERGDFSATAGSARTLEIDDVLSFPGTLIDARARERYLGEVEPVDPVAGHIPGAVNRPTIDNVGADGRFLGADELKDALARLVGDSPVAVYCGSGVTAAHQILALELAGYEAALYPGSWSGWITDPSRPRE
ncbi:sulfurtransferase [Nocardia jiangxiensis]|uniref:Sulfurtransferase n=1 Tax=Nocardia jiangxiensis TaxID=282685 RepID=A0ABW6SG08_9NOCA